MTLLCPEAGVAGRGGLMRVRVPSGLAHGSKPSAVLSRSGGAFAGLASCVSNTQSRSCFLEIGRICLRISFYVSTRKLQESNSGSVRGVCFGLLELREPQDSGADSVKLNKAPRES